MVLDSILSFSRYRSGHNYSYKCWVSYSTQRSISVKVVVLRVPCVWVHGTLSTCMWAFYRDNNIIINIFDATLNSVGIQYNSKVQAAAPSVILEHKTVKIHDVKPYD